MNKPEWKTMNDEELWEYTRAVAESGCQSSEWESIPLNKERLHKRIFENYKEERDGK